MSKIPTTTQFLKNAFKDYHPTQYSELGGIQKDVIEKALKEYAILNQIKVLEEAIEVLPVTINLHTKGVYEHMSEKVRKLKAKLK